MAGPSAAEVSILLKAQDQASAAIAKVSGELSKMGAGAAGLGSQLKGVGDSIAAATTGAAIAGVVGLAAGFTTAVTTAADFEKQMSAISAVSGATAGEMEQLQQAALDLGAKTSFSAKEAANGIEELVKAGVEIKDVLGGGAAAALDLAAAGGIKVGEAAEIAANAMNVFGLKGADMAHVADVIAGAANASAISVTDYKFSLAAAGAVAATVGVSFEDLSTAIAVMGQAGIKGSDAGTSLKTMLMNLSPTTKAQMKAFRELGIITADGSNKFFDMHGNAKSMAEIAGVLKEATKNLTKEEKLLALEAMFGSDAIRAGAVMAEAGAEGFDKMAGSIAKVTAAMVAAARLNNLSGAFEALKGSLETAAITIGLAFLPALKQVVEAVTGLVNDALPTLQTGAEQAAATFTSWLPTLQAAAVSLWENREAILSFIAALGGMAVLVTVASWISALAVLFTPLGIAIAAIGVAVLAMAAIWALGWERVKTILTTATPVLLAQLAMWGQALIDWIRPRIGPMLEALGSLLAEMGTWMMDTALPAIVAQLVEWGSAFIAWVAPMIPPLLAALGALLAALGAWLLETALPAIAAQLVQWGTAFVAWVAVAAPPLMAELAKMLAALVAWMAGTALPALAKELLAWGKAYIDWVPPAGLGMMEGLGKLAGTLFQWMHGTVYQQIKVELALWAKEFGTLGPNAIPEMLAGLAKLGLAIGDWFQRLPYAMFQYGAEAIRAFIRGFTSVSIPAPRIPSFGGSIDARALGGPVSSGSPYWVGERGPELFVPAASGRIETMAAASRLGAGGGGGSSRSSSVTQNFYGVVPETVLREMRTERRISEMLQGVFV